MQNKFKLKPQTQLDRIGRLKNKMSRFKNTPTKCKEPRTTAPERNFRFKLKPRTQLDRIERLNNQDSRTDLQSPKTKEPRPQKETAEQAQAQTPQQAAVLGRKPTSIPTLSSSAAEPDGFLALGDGAPRAGLSPCPFLLSKLLLAWWCGLWSAGCSRGERGEAYL